jgi:hypothetical protein
MTVQDLYDKIERLIDDEYRKIDAAARANYIDKETAALWSSAGVPPKLDTDVGTVVYVSKAEAVKYGRLEKLDESVRGIIKAGAVTDISALEVGGKNIYELEYNGYAWVYREGYGLPVTGGAKIKLLASTLYSDLYGQPFPDLIKKNWAIFYDDIMGAVNRGLNQGLSYTKIARTIQDATDAAYKDALRLASTEAHRIQAMSYLDGLGLLDEVGSSYDKIWLSTIDDKTRQSHIEMDGEYADDNGIFHLAGGSGPAPGMIGVAAEDINCRCRAVTSINGERPTERRIRGEGIVPFETYRDRLARGGSIPMRDVRAAKTQ